MMEQVQPLRTDQVPAEPADIPQLAGTWLLVARGVWLLLALAAVAIQLTSLPGSGSPDHQHQDGAQSRL